MDLEEQIRLHKEISQKIEELDEQKKTLSQTIMNVMTEPSLKMGNYVVKRFSRLSISMTVDEARSLDAVILEEAVDKDKIKTLYKSGTPMPGVKEVNYIQIRVEENAQN